MDRGAWWAEVHRVAQSWTQQKRFNIYVKTFKQNDTPVNFCSTQWNFKPWNLLFVWKQD